MKGKARTANFKLMIFSRLIKHVLCIIVFPFLINACQSSHQITQSPISPASINRFHINGKLGFHTLNDQGSVNFSWTSAQDHYDITLNNSFGLFLARVEGTSKQASLLTREGQRLTGSPESLLSENLNIHFPIPVLFFWLRGLPHPDMPVKLLGQNQFEQMNWQVHFLEFRKDIHLPTKMKLLDINDQTQSTIVIYWQNFS